MSSEWCATLARFGWLGVQCELEGGAASPAISVGIPHPRHGIMRATLIPTQAPSLTRLASFVVDDVCGSLPRIYVGTHFFTDTVHGKEQAVMGIIVFRGAAGDVQRAPLSVVEWRPSVWLPYFEDHNDWVMTGWNDSGSVQEIFKPCGWGCQPALGPLWLDEGVASTGSCCAEQRKSP